MHTITIPGDGATSVIHVHHNSDWSGVAILICDGNEYRVPGRALLRGNIPPDCTAPPPILYRAIAAAAREWMRDRMIGVVEQLDPTGA